MEEWMVGRINVAVVSQGIFLKPYCLFEPQPKRFIVELSSWW